MQNILETLFYLHGGCYIMLYPFISWVDCDYWDYSFYLIGRIFYLSFGFISSIGLLSYNIIYIYHIYIYHIYIIHHLLLFSIVSYHLLGWYLYLRILYPASPIVIFQDAVAAMAHGCKAFTESFWLRMDRIVIQWGYDGDLVGFPEDIKMNFSEDFFRWWWYHGVLCGYNDITVIWWDLLGYKVIEHF